MVLDPNALTIGFRPPVCHLQAGRSDLPPVRRAGRTDEQPATSRCSSSSPARPIRPTSPASNSSRGSPTCGTIRGFAGRIVFVEDYDINVARHLVQGVDVWLNNPRRPMEASGTSGMKAVLNGGAELLDPRRLVGGSLQRQERLRDRQRHQPRRRPDYRRPRCREPDARDARRSDPAVLRPRRRRPAATLDRHVVDSIATLAARFSAHRMVMDYVRECYLVAAGGLSSDMTKQ